MLYQQHTRLPIDIELQTHDESEDGEDDMDSEVIIEKLLQSKEIFSAVQHTIYDAQKNQKETYNCKHLPEELPIGAEVLVKNMADKKHRKGEKLNLALAWSLHYQ